MTSSIPPKAYSNWPQSQIRCNSHSAANINAAGSAAFCAAASASCLSHTSAAEPENPPGASHAPFAADTFGAAASAAAEAAAITFGGAVAGCLP